MNNYLFGNKASIIFISLDFFYGSWRCNLQYFKCTDLHEEFDSPRSFINDLLQNRN